MKMFLLLAVAVVFTAGCSSIDPKAGSVGPNWGVPSPNHVAPASTPSNSTTSCFHQVNLNPHDCEESRSVVWTPVDSPRLRLSKADTDSSSQAASGAAPPGETLFSKDYWKLVGSDIKETFTAPAHWETRDWLIAGGVTAGIGLTMAFDKDIQQAVQRNRNSTVDSVFDAVEPFGAEYAPGVVGAFYLGGVIFKDQRAKAVALDGLSASIIASGLILQPLKYGIGRSRPSDNQGAYRFEPFSGKDSFPSGHSTEAFTLATVIAEHYDSLWVKLSSYGIASMVGYARLNNNSHWASDVVAGAAIGTVVGHVVVHFNQNHRNVLLQPMVGPDMQGVSICFSF
jgi:hypothetical protein